MSFTVRYPPDTSEEVALKEILLRLRVSYELAAKPYVERLIQIQSLKQSSYEVPLTFAKEAGLLEKLPNFPKY